MINETICSHAILVMNKNYFIALDVKIPLQQQTAVYNEKLRSQQCLANKEMYFNTTQYAAFQKQMLVVQARRMTFYRKRRVRQYFRHPEELTCKNKLQMTYISRLSILRNNCLWQHDKLCDRFLSAVRKCSQLARPRKRFLLLPQENRQ